MAQHKTYGPGFLSRARKDRGLSRAGLAEALNISVATLSNWNSNGVPEKKADLVMAGLDSFDESNHVQSDEERRSEAAFNNGSVGKPTRRVRIGLDMFTNEELLAELASRGVEA